MPAWFFSFTVSVILVLAGTAAFFFTVTRGALIVRSVLSGPERADAHVYPIYSNMRLIRLVDFQPIIAAILLFQYDRLVAMITSGMSRMDLKEKKVLITSCAFGNVMPRVVKAAVGSGATKVQVIDIIRNELVHAQSKLTAFADQVEFLHQDATSVALPDRSVSVNVVFFLLHELPHHLKGEVLKEACRVLEPGGQLFLAEFHRPNLRILRALSWTYFKVFEPLGLALWHTHDPLVQLQAIDGISCERRKRFFGNFQVIVATKQARPFAACAD